MGGELVSSSPPKTYTEVFYDQFPYYLSIGMTYDQYWNDDCELVKYYRKADEITKKRKNQELWLQGAYIYEALCDVSPALHAFSSSPVHPYSDKPYALTAKERKADEEVIRKAKLEKFKTMFKTWSENLNLPTKEEVSTNVNND